MFSWWIFINKDICTIKCKHQKKCKHMNRNPNRAFAGPSSQSSEYFHKKSPETSLYRFVFRMFPAYPLSEENFTSLHIQLYTIMITYVPLNSNLQLSMFPRREKRQGGSSRLAVKIYFLPVGQYPQDSGPACRRCFPLQSTNRWIFACHSILPAACKSLRETASLRRTSLAAAFFRNSYGFCMTR